MSCYDVYGCKQHIPFISNRFCCAVILLDLILSHIPRNTIDFTRNGRLPQKEKKHIVCCFYFGFLSYKSFEYIQNYEISCYFWQKSFVLIDLTQQATISCNRPIYWTALMR